ncbi:MAG: chemotaxis protein CheB [Candidatus Riflebacteria bacterium]|nr:chemotaxis protein CheB [Candidatus Riflebacteria bacterium]
MSTIKVLVVDDSRLMRNLLSSIMQKAGDIQIVGGADNGIEALDKIRELRPDVVALDLNMPVMDGLQVLREAKARNLQAAFLVISSLAKENAQITLDAISLGAIDFISKPPQTLNIEQLSDEIISKIRVAYGVLNRPEAPGGPAALREGPPLPLPAPGAAQPTAAQPAKAPVRRDHISALALTIFGGSSGAIQTLRKVIPYLRSDLTSTIVLVLPLPPFFVSQFAAELARQASTPVLEVAEDMTVEMGKVYICPGGRTNIILVEEGAKVFFRGIENTTDKIYTPSIDVFMESAAVIYRERCRGVLISGTGVDGVQGLAAIKTRGGKTYVEDVTSAVAKQLPVAAQEAGVAMETVDIAGIIRMLK